MNKVILEKIKSTYQRLFNDDRNLSPSTFKEPVLIAAPGRINILGEHTDYNDGFVLPAAIDKMTFIMTGLSGSDQCKVMAYNLDEVIEFSINDNFERQEKHWNKYLFGILNELKKKDYPVKGFNCVFGGDIPIGGGLSSSAAMECGILYSLNQLFEFNLNRMEIALMGQASEHNFVGIKCGIMDQFANMHGKTNHALELDCRTLDFKYHPSSFDNISFLLFDTNISHSLANSEYNNRRISCEKGVSAIQKKYNDVTSLRDANISQLASVKDKLSEEDYRKCEYIIKENLRVKQAAEALENNDFQLLGKIMYTTHDGLSKDYEVSCDELDFLVSKTLDRQDILGARMMGGGFGGCTLNLMLKEYDNGFVEEVKEQYNQRFGREMSVYNVNITDGTQQIN